MYNPDALFSDMPTKRKSDATNFDTTATDTKKARTTKSNTLDASSELKTWRDIELEVGDQVRSIPT